MFDTLYKSVYFFAPECLKSWTRWLYWWSFSALKFWNLVSCSREKEHQSGDRTGFLWLQSCHLLLRSVCSSVKKNRDNPELVGALRSDQQCWQGLLCHQSRWKVGGIRAVARWWVISHRTVWGDEPICQNHFRGLFRTSKVPRDKISYLGVIPPPPSSFLAEVDRVGSEKLVLLSTGVDMCFWWGSRFSRRQRTAFEYNIKNRSTRMHEESTQKFNTDSTQSWPKIFHRSPSPGTRVNHCWLGLIFGTAGMDENQKVQQVWPIESPA